MKTTIYLLALLCILSLLFAQGIPSGFTSITPGPGLIGWHASTISHHGNTSAWKVENGVLSGTQDKPGNGGIVRRIGAVERATRIVPQPSRIGGLARSM